MKNKDQGILVEWTKDGVVKHGLVVRNNPMGKAVAGKEIAYVLNDKMEVVKNDKGQYTVVMLNMKKVKIIGYQD